MPLVLSLLFVLTYQSQPFLNITNKLVNNEIFESSKEQKTDNFIKNNDYMLFNNYTKAHNSGFESHSNQNHRVVNHIPILITEDKPLDLSVKATKSNPQFKNITWKSFYEYNNPNLNVKNELSRIQEELNNLRDLKNKSINPLVTQVVNTKNENKIKKQDKIVFKKKKNTRCSFNSSSLIVELENLVRSINPQPTKKKRNRKDYYYYTTDDEVSKLTEGIKSIFVDENNELNNSFLRYLSSIMFEKTNGKYSNNIKELKEKTVDAFKNMKIQSINKTVTMAGKIEDIFRMIETYESEMFKKHFGELIAVSENYKILLSNTNPCVDKKVLCCFTLLLQNVINFCRDKDNLEFDILEKIKMKKYECCTKVSKIVTRCFIIEFLFVILINLIEDENKELDLQYNYHLGAIERFIFSFLRVSTKKHFDTKRYNIRDTRKKIREFINKSKLLITT